MSSSGLIYAVIVGAWAAYLVPMWLRRQDELNEARPTERFSTAIRLLSGRAAMERRYAKDLEARPQEADEPPGDPGEPTGSVDVRALAMPVTAEEPLPARGAAARDGVHARVEGADGRAEDTAGAQASDGAPQRASRQDALPADRDHRDAARKAPGRSGRTRGQVAAEAVARSRRSKLLTRRRRTTVLLFVAFTLGAVAAAVGGVTFLWAPGVPAVLLSVYIAHLRAQERRRFTYTMDRRRAEAAARRLRERRGHPAADGDQATGAGRAGVQAPAGNHREPAGPGRSELAAGRRALVEQTDHAEWVDQQRERRRRPGPGDSWEPVPVPLPTYVTAPVAPRAGGDLDLGAPGTWSSARSSTARPPADAGGDRGVAQGEPTGASGAAGDGAEPPTPARPGRPRRDPGAPGTDAPRRGGARDRGRTPLFDQYADDDHPRAAGQ